MTSDPPDILTAAADAGYQRGHIDWLREAANETRVLILHGFQRMSQPNLSELLGVLERLIYEREQANAARTRDEAATDKPLAR